MFICVVNALEKPSAGVAPATVVEFGVTAPSTTGIKVFNCIGEAVAVIIM